MQLLNLQLTFKLNSKFLFLSFQFNILWSMSIKWIFQLINWKRKLRIFCVTDKEREKHRLSNCSRLSAEHDVEFQTRASAVQDRPVMDARDES